MIGKSGGSYTRRNAHALPQSAAWRAGNGDRRRRGEAKLTPGHRLTAHNEVTHQSTIAQEDQVQRIWPCAASCAGAALIFAAELTVLGTPTAQASVCGSVGGARVDISGCVKR